MPAQVDFSHDGKTAILTYEGQFVLDDLRYTDAHVAPFLDRATEPVMIIVDIRALTSMVPGVLTVRTSPLFSHENTRGIIFVGGNTLLRAMADVAIKLADFKNARFVKSLDEALRMSAQHQV